MRRKLIYLVCLISLVSPALYGSPQPDTIWYDDGNPLRMDMHQNALFAVRFTPVQPFTLMAIDLMVRNDYNTADGCKLWVAQDNGGIPAWPATYVGQAPAPLPDQQWVQFDLAGPMYFEGDFFIVAQQKGGPYPSGSFWMGIDYGTTTNRTRKSYTNGQSWQTESQGDALIRAMGRYGTAVPTSPYPADGATLVPMDVEFRWTPWPGAVGQDLYIGTDLEAVLNANKSSPEYVGRLPGDASTYDPGPLKPCTGYYWRIDTVPCPVCPLTQGPVWDMTTTCESPALTGDINGDCRVDFMDLAILANNWLAEEPYPCVGEKDKCAPTPEELTPPLTPEGYEYVGYDVVINFVLTESTIPLDYNESPDDISHTRSRTVVKDGVTVCDIIVRHLFKKKDECAPTREELTPPPTPEGYEYVGYSVVINFRLTETTIPPDYTESMQDISFIRSRTIVKDGQTVCDIIVRHLFRKK
jgi:hypothetical protein